MNMATSDDLHLNDLVEVTYGCNRGRRGRVTRLGFEVVTVWLYGDEAATYRYEHLRKVGLAELIADTAKYE